MTTPNPGENRASEATWIVYSREHNLWWRTNRSGYAPCIEEAGRYTRAEAERICRDAGTGRGDRSEFDEGPPEFCVPDPTHTAALAAELARVKARCECLEREWKELGEIIEAAPELNTNNYDHDQVCELNAKMIEAALFHRDALRAADPKPAPGATP